MPALLRRHRQLYRTDDYGIVDDKKWMFEVNRFCDKVVTPALNIRVTPHLGPKSEPRRAPLDIEIASLVATAANAQQATFTDRFDPAISPIDYEHFCAARLRLSGWVTNVTQASADQGADIIATKDGRTLVVQCKHYAKPVGNKAVQEIVAAKMHYNADDGLVIATNGFTRSADALASTNNIMLVSHDDLTADFVLLAQ